MKKLKVVLVGAGDRGIAYTNIMSRMPEKYQVIAVAEPIDVRRNYIQTKHNIPDAMCFSSWEDLFRLGKIADIALIATMDRDHFAPAYQAMDLHYDILLEKPISVNTFETIRLADQAERERCKAVVCTVLRYTGLYVAIKSIIDEGKIGNVVSINHEECVGNLHQSHSFVRGNWGNEARSTFMLLAKSCHDLDLLQWLVGKQVRKIQSFGGLTYFREENAPKGAPDYCIQGCPHGETCFYNAVKLYYDDKENNWFRSTAARKVKPTDEEVKEAITSTQYGKCVFKCDNDVVDHQTVNMLFEDEVTITFTMNAFNKGGRSMHIMGTKGELYASLDETAKVSVYDFATRETTEIKVAGKEGLENGHGGGDLGIVEALYSYVLGEYSGNSIPTIRQSSDNHLLAFAAEEARRTGTVVDFNSFKAELNQKIAHMQFK